MRKQREFNSKARTIQTKNRLEYKEQMLWRRWRKIQPILWIYAISGMMPPSSP